MTQFPKISLNFILAALGYASLQQYLLHHIQGFSVGFFVGFLLMLMLRAPILCVQRLMSVGPTAGASFMLFRLLFLTDDFAAYRGQALGKAKAVLGPISAHFAKRAPRNPGRKKGKAADAGEFQLD